MTKNKKYFDIVSRLEKSNISIEDVISIMTSDICEGLENFNRNNLSWGDIKEKMVENRMKSTKVNLDGHYKFQKMLNQRLIINK